MAAGDPPLIGARSAGVLRGLAGGSQSAPLPGSMPPSGGLPGASPGPPLGVPGAFEEEPPSRIIRPRAPRIITPEEDEFAGGFGGGLHPAWISQRTPAGRDATEDPLEQPLMVDMATARRDPTMISEMANRIRSYPNLTDAEKAGSDDDVVRRFQQHIVQNLVWMYDHIPKHIRARSAIWYEGAHRIARKRAEQFGIPLASVAGVYAALSPQKDWYQNASLGDRLIDIYHNHGHEGLTKDMAKKAQELFGEKDPALVARLKQGKSLHDMRDLEDKGAWIRVYDLTHNRTPEQRGHYVITPEGSYQKMRLTKGGKPYDTVWSFPNDIAKAVGALEANGDVRKISKLMGEKHKVRNFYNNILDPWSPARDITSDTHAVASGLLRALGLNAPEVLHNLGAAPTRKGLGLKGTYPIFADAYREAADLLGISPRELQSIDWEGGRGLFSPEFKRNEQKQKAVDRMWQERGTTSPHIIRANIHDFAGGIDLPEWAE